MTFDHLANSREHMTLSMLKAFLEDLSKCPPEARDALLSRIRVDLLKIISSSCFGYIPKLFDLLMQEAEWQLLCCLINLLDWLPIGKKKLVASVELYQKVKKFGESNLPWKVSCKVEKHLLLSKYCAQKVHEKWKYLLNPKRGDFLRLEKRKFINNRITKVISKQKEDYRAEISVSRLRPSLGSLELQSTPKKKKKARRVSFPPDECLVSIRYIDIFSSNEKSSESDLSNGSAEIAGVKLNDADNYFSDGSEIAWFPPCRLYTETSLRWQYAPRMTCADQNCDTFCPDAKDELTRLENFYLKDFQDSVCIEIPLVSMNY
ncbi:hypothetical protein GpartN1_g2728.t1 [Galdieria partita]|uniref:Uncharacterized protein n=1 Tax=Galdieria partita TaxID=83374 RepID=A0A9C7PVW8_9RHOD|nr:hypothetical protein GpartN1_g2728.t1 [Galdieria partita]